jgi:hypothetical protein
MTGLNEQQRGALKRELTRRLPESPTGRPHWEGLLLQYGDSGLAPPHLLAEIISGDDHKFWTNVWEAMLYRHLSSLGFDVRGNVKKAGQRGPDFRIEHQGRTIWIEAVTPEPKGLPKEWVEPPKMGEVRVRSMPHEAMLLRWTSVLKDKRDKLEADADAGIIADGDCTIVAVNCCCLRDIATDDLGISQLPFAVEAAFPIGPLAIPITPEGKIDGEAAHLPRFKVRKPTGIDVPTGCFLDPRYANVSAIASAYQKHTIDRPLALTIVHNPLARAPLATGNLGAIREYFAEEDGNHYALRT